MIICFSNSSLIKNYAESFSNLNIVILFILHASLIFISCSFLGTSHFCYEITLHSFFLFRNFFVPHKLFLNTLFKHFLITPNFLN